MTLSRRDWLRAAGVSTAAAALSPDSFARSMQRPDEDPGVVAISSSNGLRAVARAYEQAVHGRKPVDAAVAGVSLVEDDPTDITVGLGGRPNEEGVVQLDAAVMDGPTHNAGSVACLEGVRNPSAVALRVMRNTDHVNLVGRGAQRFALMHGFKLEELLTEESRLAWVQWKAGLSERDDWFPLTPEQLDQERGRADREREWGTIHCSVRNAEADLGCTTSTSGLFYKIPGRVGDSPLIGCGLYCDNTVGSAGATGRGEAAILSGGSWLVVERMRMGENPTDACLSALVRVAEQAARQGGPVWDTAKKRPAFNLTFYAVDKAGRYGSASLLGQRGFAICDADGPREETGEAVFSL